MTERLYAMTRVAAGDYLLPSNDQQTLWRICLQDETDNDRLVRVWSAWRYVGPGWPDALPDEFIEWEWDSYYGPRYWREAGSWFRTRGEAIEYAMEHPAP